MANHFHPHARGARLHNPDALGGGPRKIDAAADIRAAVDDANLHALVVSQIHHPDQGVEGKGGMGRGERVHIVRFAAGGGLAVVGVAVPTGEAVFRVARLRGRGRNQPQSECGRESVPGRSYGKSHYTLLAQESSRTTKADFSPDSRAIRPESWLAASSLDSAPTSTLHMGGFPGRGTRRADP